MIPALPEHSGIGQRPIARRSFPGSPPGKRWEGAGEGGGQRRRGVCPPWGGCRARRVAWGDGRHPLWGWGCHRSRLRPWFGTVHTPPHPCQQSPEAGDCGGDTLTSRRLVRGPGVGVASDVREKEERAKAGPGAAAGPSAAPRWGQLCGFPGPTQARILDRVQGLARSLETSLPDKVLAITLHKKQNGPKGGGQGLVPSPRAGVSLKLNVGEQLTQVDAFGRAPDQHLPSGAGTEWVS